MKYCVTELSAQRQALFPRTLAIATPGVEATKKGVNHAVHA